MVVGFHADGDVFDLVVDGLFCLWFEFPCEDSLGVAFVWCEVLVAVVGDVFSESFAFVDESEWCPEVFEAVGGGGSGESYDSVDVWADLFEGFESLGLW